METAINYIVENWDKIDDKFKKSLKPEYGSNQENIKGIESDEHTVILLLDRQKPSVEQSWDFDEERIGVTKTGKIIWGFDSGCSCPSPWEDSYPGCYSVTKEWKQFEVKTEDFDQDWEKECLETLEEIKSLSKLN